ncbi:DUF418 domain-containing protein [Nocardiopsis coralliicola]
MDHTAAECGPRTAQGAAPHTACRAPGTAADRAGARGSAPSPAAAPAPFPAASRRLPLLDLLRGLAILGTFATNVWIFTAPGAEAGVLGTEVSAGGLGALITGGVPDPGEAAAVLFRFAANGTSLALLTLLFGAGLAVQYRSAQRRGLRWPGPYKWRALFLFTEGLVHFTLVFSWDVLMGYAVTALATAWLLTRADRVRRTVAWTAGTVHVLLMGALTAGLLWLTAAGAGGDGGPDGELVALYAHGSYADQILFRLQHIAVLRLEPVLTLGLLLVLFLAGAALLRSGAFTLLDDAGHRLRVRLACWGLGAGLPLKLAAAAGGPDLFLAERYLAAPLVALGLAGAVGLLAERFLLREQRGLPGALSGAVAALGRTAMTGYILQNVLAMLLCYGIGLGLAERMQGAGAWWVLGLWAGISAALLVAAALWTRRFAQGPLEALQKAVLARLPQR